MPVTPGVPVAPGVVVGTPGVPVAPGVVVGTLGVDVTVGVSLPLGVGAIVLPDAVTVIATTVFASLYSFVSGEVTVISAVPDPTIVTFPSLSTDTIFSSEEI